MADIQGDLGSALAQILDVRGGRVRIEDLRDTEGVSLVYDLASLAKGQLLTVATRVADTGAIAASTAWELLLQDLPVGARILAIDVATDDSTRIQQAGVYQTGLGAAPRDSNLWFWATGDDTGVIPAGIQIGAFVPTAQLYADANKVFLPNVFVSGVTNRSRLGQAGITFAGQTIAFGAGTVRINAQITIAFWIGLGGDAQALDLP